MARNKVQTENRSFRFPSFLCGILILLSACKVHSLAQGDEAQLIVLGIAQDAGFPQADCKKSCCKDLWDDLSKRKMISCLGLKDPKTGQVWMFDATPDFKDQLHRLKRSDDRQFDLAGIFLTHAHIGHYTGLMELGREAMGADNISVYAMPRMKTYLENNGPWSQLVQLKNIRIDAMEADQKVELTDRISVVPILVPHRDEYSETVGFIIQSDRKKILFIPDIDKWYKWERNILDYIRQVDVAFLDGSFYRNGEIRGRDMGQIPHPFVEESLDLFASLEESDQKKIHFIHLNHTNPLLNPSSEAYQIISNSPFHVAREMMIVDL